jgi:hypothetical protein
MKPLRSPFAWWLGWIWLAFAAFNLVDVMTSDATGPVASFAAATLVASCAAAYVLALRPRVVADDDGLRIVNPLRTVVVPWGGVTEVDVTDVVRVHMGEAVYRVWALRENKRRQVRDNLLRASGSAEAPEEPETELRPAEAKARELRTEVERRMAGRRSAGSAQPPEPYWSPPAVAAVLVAALVLLGAVVLR